MGLILVPHKGYDKHALADISLTYTCPMCNTWYRILILVPRVHVVYFSSLSQVVICQSCVGTGQDLATIHLMRNYGKRICTTLYATVIRTSVRAQALVCLGACHVSSRLDYEHA